MLSPHTLKNFIRFVCYCKCSCKIGIYRGDEYSNLRFAQTSNQRVILNGSEVLRGSYVEPSKTCACAGIYDEISTTFLRKVTFYM